MKYAPVTLDSDADLSPMRLTTAHFETNTPIGAQTGASESVI